MLLLIDCFTLLKEIFSSLKDTRLIFVVGQTGSGKTTLLGEITSQKLEIGHTATSGRIAHLTLVLDDIC